jgi:methylmalonyl-CoA/ethylmalonyl-CoA epimerase
MKVNKIDHICIAVKDLDAARRIWEPILGKPEPDDPYVDEPEKIRVARYWLGDVGFELMESTSPDGDVAKFIEKRGEGIMLIGLRAISSSAERDHSGIVSLPLSIPKRSMAFCWSSLITNGMS